jgi:hypothetical protein
LFNTTRTHTTRSSSSSCLAVFFRQVFSKKKSSLPSLFVVIECEYYFYICSVNSQASEVVHFSRLSLYLYLPSDSLTLCAKFAMSSANVENKPNKPIAPLVYEKPCPHMTQPFPPCLATATICKWKMVTRMAETFGFPTETHKLLMITPIVREGEKELFPPSILELNFGSDKLLSSGAHMRCLDCAGVKDDSIIMTGEYTICVEYEFLVRAAKEYVDTIKFFGPRKSNCQSYVYFLLRIHGISAKTLMRDKIVETDEGYVSKYVKLLAGNMMSGRPTCLGDEHPIDATSSTVHFCYIMSTQMKMSVIECFSKVKLDRRIPTTIEQFELDEFDDEIGKRYIKFFGVFIFSNTSLFVMAFAIILLYW